MPDLHLLSPRGFRAGAVYAGIKTKPSNDIGLLVCDVPAIAAAVFTTNRVFAAPVLVGREHIASGRLRGIVVNSGNANACTGPQGEADARRMCEIAAGVFHCEPEDVLPSSTGIIGHLLPMPKIERGIVEAAGLMGDSAEHALAFGDAIMTTDLKRKSAATSFKIGKQTITIAGVAKGSGMIGPRMSLKGPPQATMLAYLTTDARIGPAPLRQALASASENSFNAVTVDDHVSTNDTACILASGESGALVRDPAMIVKFVKALSEVCQSLAQQIAADGEGATKVVRIDVKNCDSGNTAKTIARTIANSPLVKAAMHGNDPNWGRIVSAAGMAGVPFNPDKATLTLQGTVVFQKGRPVAIDAVAVSDSLKSAEVVVTLNCGNGKESGTVWTCDLAEEYVTINADYHT